MRLLAGIALLGLAIASSLTWVPKPHITEDRFLVGREYRYIFDGQITTGLSIPDVQQSATRLQAIVTLHPVDERLTLLQLTKVRFGSIQEEFEPRRLLPFERFQLVKLDKEHEDMLTLPIRFTYRHGMVSDIEFSDEDMPWSVNIKKAVLNMLQINLLKEHEMKNERDDETYNKNFFATVERTLEGECEVEYTTTDMKAEFMEWTKSINFQKCNVRPEVQYGIRPRDFRKTKDEKLFSTVFKYKIAGNKDEFLIHNVELQSQYKLMPLSKKHELITSFVLNKMTLIYAGKVETEIPKVRVDRTEDLIYNFEWELAEEKFAMTGDEKYLNRLPEWRNKVEHIEKLFNTMIRHIVEDRVELEHTHMFARLVELLRLCREQELVKIQRFLENNEKVNDKVLSLYHDALAMAGTKVTVEQLVKRIIEEKIDTLKAARLLKSLSEVRVPSEQIAHEILRVCESDVSERVPYLKQSCWLTYGSIFNGLCNNEKLAVYSVERNVCRRELKEKIVRKLMEKFRRVETRYEKVLMLKTLANAGIDVSVHELEKIINDKKEEKIIRLEAIHALRKLRFIMPRKIQSILMPIFKDRTEFTELRMVALRKMMETNPEQIIIDQIVRQMEVERSQYLRAFIYRTLKTISESPEINEETVHYVRRALRIIDVEFYENLNKHVRRYTVKNMDDRFGISWEMNTLLTKDSVLPKEVHSTLDTILGGEWHKYFVQFGITQQNVDEVMNRLLRRLQDSDMENLMVRGKRSSTYHPAEIFKTIYEKLNFVRRHPTKEHTHAMIYFRYKDMDYAFLPLDVDTIPRIIKNMFRDGKLQLDEVERFLATGTPISMTGGFYVYEYVRKMPTTFGLPLVLTSKMPTVATIQGHIKVEMEPKESKIFDGLRMRLHLKPMIATTHVVKAVVHSPIVENGFKMLHSATFDHPLETHTELTWKHKLRMKTVFRPIKHKKNVFHLQSRPVTFIRHLKKTTHAYPEPNEVTVHFREHSYPINSFERTYMKRYGIIMKLTGTMHRPVVRHMESLLNPVLIGYNTLDVHVEQTADMPEEYVMHTEIETFIPERMDKPDLKMFFKNNDEMFNVEAEDIETRRKDVRETHISTYLRNFEIEKAYKHRLFFKVQTVGKRENHEAEMELKAICDTKYRFCRTHLFARRTPMENENRDWEMKVEVETLYPEMPRTLRQFKEQAHRELLGIIDAKWGSDYKNNMFIRLQGEQSREQKLWMKKINREDNKLTEMEKLKVASRLNLYKMLAKYELTPETEYYMTRLFSLLKAWNMWNTEYERVHNTKGIVRAHLEIEPYNRRMFDLSIQTPRERVLMKRVPMPIMLPTVSLHEMHTLELNNLRDVVHHVVKHNRAECIVKSKMINTFDNLLLRTPISNCYTVLAKDCTSEEPRFVVLMRKVSKHSEEKKLKIVTRDRVYTIEMVDGKLMAKVNDRLIRREDFNKYGIVNADDQFYKIDIEDVVVLFDGYEANLKLSHLYKNKQCGVCGHYDGERWNDLRRADNEETSTVEEFHRSYITRDDECDFDEEEIRTRHNERLENQMREHNHRYNEFEVRDEDYRMVRNEEEDRNKNPILRTKVIERKNKICFSVEPVHMCPEYTTEEDVKREEVEFVCRRETREMRRLLRKAREEVIPRDMLEDGEMWRTTVRVPRMCSVY